MANLGYELNQIGFALGSLASEVRKAGENVIAINLEELSLTMDKKAAEARQGADKVADLEAENKRLREAYQELYRLARDVADSYRETSWDIGTIHRLIKYIDNQNQ